ncbi:MAG: glycosyltransferase family 2 protein [Burkholderiales bacterium]
MTITASIVSHGHAAQIAELLVRLAELQNPDLRRVVLTANIPEPELERICEKGRWPFDLQRIENQQPAGFGANHNRAFALDGQLGASQAFAVINPDVRLTGDPFPALIQALATSRAGCAYPLQVGEAGCAEDHERTLPSPLELLKRYFWPRRGAVGGRAPDWVNAAFLLFPEAVYARLGGFDARYHLYCEDVDICLRVQLAGLQLVRAPGACVIHAGRRATRTSGQHFLWHVASLWRLWNSDAYRNYQLLREKARL